MAESPDFTMDGKTLYLQFMAPERIVEIAPGVWRFELRDGDYYSTSDRDAGRSRAEMRWRTLYPLDVWSTFAYTIERDPATYPNFGLGPTDRAHKVTQAQFFNDTDADDRPSFWIEQLGDVHGIFLNSYVTDGPKGLQPIPMAWGSQRVALQVRPWADGTIDIRLWVDGEPVFSIEKGPFEAPGGIVRPHPKLGLYMNKGRGMISDGSPTLVATYREIVYKPGETATSEDIFGSGAPAPTPSPTPTPAPSEPTPEPLGLRDLATLSSAVLDGMAVSLEGQAAQIRAIADALRSGE